MIIRTLAKFAISAGLLGLIFATVPFAEVLASVQAVQLWPVLIGVGLTPLMVYLSAAQTKVLLHKQGITLTTGQIVRINFITRFYGLFLPGVVAGGAIRWYRFARNDGKPAEALATILFARLLYTMLALVLGLGCWLLDSVARENLHFGGGLGLMLIILASTIWLFCHRNRAARIVAYLDSLSGLPRIVRSAGRRFLLSMLAFRGLGLKQMGLLLIVYSLEHLLGLASYVLFALALNIDLGIASLAWVRTYILLLALAPISISNLGVREGGLIYMLASYGVAPGLALAFSLLLFSRNVVAALIGGLLEVWGPGGVTRGKCPSSSKQQRV